MTSRALFAGWRHHAFVTNRHGDAVVLDAKHRAHAVVELAIRDLERGDGLNHCPSGMFNANAAWLLATTLAHSLVRWTQLLGAPAAPRLANAKTFRRRLLTIPGRLIRTARRCDAAPTRTLALAARVRRQSHLERLRALPTPM